MIFISSAYIIAGSAISPLLNIKGDDAMAIACAAFCMPASMTIVRRAALSLPAARDKMELPPIASRMRRAAEVPSIAMFL